MSCVCLAVQIKEPVSSRFRHWLRYYADASVW